MRIGENQNRMNVHVAEGSELQYASAQEMKEHRVRGSFQMNDNGQAYDAIAQKKQQAQRQAMKLVKDVYASEQKAAEDLKERGERIVQLREESAEAESKLGELKDRKQDLMEEYGIEDGSAQQQDLELLEKRRELQKSRKGALLTQEEQRRLEQIDREGLTEYQKRCLELDVQADPYRDTIEKNRKQIREEISIISEAKLEALKVRPMLKATQAAEAIMHNAGEEALGSLLAEGQSYLDEKAKETEEALQKQKEEKKEKEEQIEAVLEKLGLTLEDLKGAAVDELL